MGRSLSLLKKDSLAGRGWMSASKFLQIRMTLQNLLLPNTQILGFPTNPSIIYGNVSKEVELGDNEENTFNFLFDHCILQVPDTFNVSNKNKVEKDKWIILVFLNSRRQIKFICLIVCFF